MSVIEIIAPGYLAGSVITCAAVCYASGRGYLSRYDIVPVATVTFLFWPFLLAILAVIYPFSLIFDLGYKHSERPTDD